MTLSRYLAPLSFAACLVPAAHAQNLGGVFGPVVNEGHKQAQYRAAYTPDTEAFGQRLWYQQALNGDFMFRGVVQTRKTADSDADFDFIEANLFWDLGEDGDNYRSGFRFDARIRGDGRPGGLAANWINQWRPAPDWTTRFLVLASIDVGDNGRDGVLLGTRAMASYSGYSAATLGVEMYSSYGSTDDFRDIDDQTHQLGPTATFRLGGGFNLYTNILFGLTDATLDEELRLRVIRTF